MKLFEEVTKERLKVGNHTANNSGVVRKGYMRFAMAAVLALTLFCSSFSSPAFADDQYTANTMRLLATVGTVEVIGAGGEQREIMENERLDSGDIIRTAPSSRASIGLDTDQIVTLDELGEVELTKNNGKLVLNLRQGVLFFDVRRKLRDEESLEIRTSTMAVGIRGTQGGVAANVSPKKLEVSDDGRNTVAVDSGKLIVSGLYLTEGVVDVRFSGLSENDDWENASVISISAGQGVEIYGTREETNPEALTISAPVAVPVDPNMRVTYSIEEVHQGVVTNALKAENLLTGFAVHRDSGTVIELGVIGDAAEDAYSDNGEETITPVSAEQTALKLKKAQTRLQKEEETNNSENTDSQAGEGQSKDTEPESVHSMIHVPARTGDCETAGNIEFYYCTKCGKYFSDAEGTTPLAESEIEVVVSHTLKKYEAKEASCKEAGHVEYYQCENCGRYFGDKDAANEIIQAETEISALGHDLYPLTESTASGSRTFYQCLICGKYFLDSTGETEITETEIESLQ